MRIFVDFHIHSKYSRATSKDMNLEKLSEWGSKKGLNIIGTGDFTHPGWFSELKQKLELAKAGLYKFKNGQNPKTYFILTAEVSSIYSKDGQVRKIHNLIFAPDLETVKKINERLTKIGNLWSDGRPILGLDAKELLKIVLDVSPDCFLVPAHIWTPWFSLFGSKSGFDAIEECFEDLSEEIFAVETGLSSDPEMNWRLSALDRISLISNSDCHSPANLARECNVFEMDKNDLSFAEIKRILKEKDSAKFLYTIEFFPQEGKYHHDGHRNCNISFSPAETKKHKGICPECERKLTVGVSYRVDELADRAEGKKPKNAPGSKHLIPLSEIIADVFGVGKLSKKVYTEYEKIVTGLGSELEVLLDVPASQISKITLPQIAENIEKMRQGKVEKIPGYDGVYGKISVVKDDLSESAKESVEESEESLEQPSLF